MVWVLNECEKKEWIRRNKHWFNFGANEINSLECDAFFWYIFVSNEFLGGAWNQGRSIFIVAVCFNCNRSFTYRKANSYWIGVGPIAEISRINASSASRFEMVKRQCIYNRCLSCHFNQMTNNSAEGCQNPSSSNFITHMHTHYSQ